MSHNYARSHAQQNHPARLSPIFTKTKRHAGTWVARSRERQSVLMILWAALLLTGLSLQSARAQDCSVAALTNTTTTRDMQLTVTCPNAPFFKLSESPDFKESTDNGVTVSIDYIDPMGEFADVSIRYPNGSDGGNATPFSVTETSKEVRVLVVLFTFGDGSLTPPSYATPEWANRLMFSGNHDGRGVANSIKAHIEQNSYGKVKLNGEVYPSWVNVASIEKYRDLNLTPSSDRQFAGDVIASLLENDPDFFSGKEFDFLIALTPGALGATTLSNYQLYSNWSDPNGIFEGWALFDIPVDSSSEVYDTIYNEQRVSTTDTIVVPRYNPASVEGVWLAGDTAHTGTNYYTGGRVRYDITNPNYYAHFIELGTPLPASNTEVIVTYYPRTNVRLSDEQMINALPDTLPDTVGLGFMTHELYHGMGWLLTPNGQTIGDLYKAPQQLIEDYDLMSTGSWNKISIGDDRYYVPANLSAYSKVKLDIVQPFTLRYGENEIGVRLYRSEESDFTDTNSRIKVIKVPLHALSDIGHQTLESYPNTEIQFTGEEYLLLEWRHRGTLENGGYNFDEALPNDGLVIYRAIEGNPARHGDAYQNTARIVDTTPAALPTDTLMTFRSEEIFSIERSAAPLGEDSNVYEYVADVSWSAKAADTTTANLLLSPGSGTKTVYAKFMDLNGQVVAESFVSVDLVEEQILNQPPVAVAGDEQILADDGDNSEWVTLYGEFSYDPDGTLVDYQWYEDGTSIASEVTPLVNLEVGIHTITLVVTDDLGASSSSDVQVTILAVGTPPVAIAGEDITVTDADMDNTESILLDGSSSYDADGTIVSYEWYEDGTLLAEGATATVSLGIGTHNITLSVRDDRGQVSSDTLVVEVREGGISAPDSLTATVNGSVVSLSWSDNGGSSDGFYIERGTKVKNEIVYTRVGQTAADVTSFSEIPTAGTYLYRVQAFTAAAVSDYSEALSVRVKR